MTINNLINWLESKMNMSEIYQPLIIEYLLKNKGEATKIELAQLMSLNDQSTIDYYKKILMVWPKKTLEKHGLVEYDSKKETFCLKVDIDDTEKVETARKICKEKIEDWIDRNYKSEKQLRASSRYEVLKRSGGKCELCGISSKVTPLDIDHIVPQSKADKNGKVKKDGEYIDVNDLENLQALCSHCNRSKNNKDDTDYRLSYKKLVRDNIPSIIHDSGREAVYEVVKKPNIKSALLDKLVEEHSELINDYNINEVIDVIEVAIAIGNEMGYSEEEIIKQLQAKRKEKGGFEKRIFLKEVKE